jgi:NAD(P) transhydrogenase subunit alpha
MPTLFVPRESRAGEARVAATPETSKALIKLGLAVAIERGAGTSAGFVDAAYEAAGAKLAGPEGWSAADVVAKVAPPTEAEAAKLRAGSILIAFLSPASQWTLIGALRERQISALAMELIPRITRAQAMDALSSQATVAGYKAVLVGASHMSKLCPVLMTAAGTVPPAKCVVFGAGVAGLQAIATAKRLGCAVEATDVRLAAREQVLSLGAKFIDVPGMGDMEDKGGYAKEQSPEFLEKQRQEVAKRVAEADLVITTAQIPGRAAPRLVDRAMVESMKPGAVLVDLAVESGGNCELSKPGEVVLHKGVKVVGLANLPATVPYHASELYAKNVLNLVKLFVQKDGALAKDFKDEVLAGCLLTHAGEVTHKATAEALLAAGAK